MNFSTSIWKVLQYFLDNPYEEVYLRELARKTGVSSFSTKQAVDNLVKEKILLEKRRGNMRYIKANMESLFFKYIKIASSLKKLEESGLIKFLVENVPAVSSIVLFGSVAKGEDDKKSDIDLLVIGLKKKIDLSDFERRLGKEIKVIIMKWAEWREKAEEDKAFYMEVILNGIVLYGNMPVIE